MDFNKKPIKLSKSRSGIFFNNQKTDFVYVFTYMQSVINNAFNGSSGLIFNKTKYSFRLNDKIKIITDLPWKDFNHFRLVYKKNNPKNQSYG